MSHVNKGLLTNNRSVDIPAPFKLSFVAIILQSNSHSVNWKHINSSIAIQKLESRESMDDCTSEFGKTKIHRWLYSKKMKTRELVDDCVQKSQFLVKLFKKYVQFWLNLKSKSRIHKTLQIKKAYEDDIFVPSTKKQFLVKSFRKVS